MPRPSVRIAKRLIDVVGASVGLALTAPLFPVIAAAIRRDGPGPIFFAQERAGELLEGEGLQFETFTIYKFRTMRVDAEKLTGAVIASENDPRVTPVGRFLRSSRLDELPQLWNVLRGDISLVGPRPERPEILQTLAAAIPFFEERMRGVRPGLTGLAQISLGYTGRADDDSPIAPFAKDLTNPFEIEDAEGALADDMRVKLLYDLAYSAALEDFGTFLVTELSIIFRTPLMMIARRGH